MINTIWLSLFIVAIIGTVISCRHAVKKEKQTNKRIKQRIDELHR